MFSGICAIGKGMPEELLDNVIMLSRVFKLCLRIAVNYLSLSLGFLKIIPLQSSVRMQNNAFVFVLGSCWEGE